MRPQLNPLILGPGAPWSLPGSSLDIQFTTGRAAVNRQTSSISSLLTTTRASTGYASTSTGSLTLFPTNTPRITDLGLLVEQAATNLALQSTFNGTWTAPAATLTANVVTSPDGTANAATLIENSASAQHYTLQTFTKAASSLAYTGSVYAKPIGGRLIAVQLDDGTNGVTLFFDITTGAVGSSTPFGAGFTKTSGTITAASGGFYRCSLSVTSTTSTTIRMVLLLASSDGTTNYLGNGTSGASLFGAQLEQNAFATSYIPTTTVAVTRAADLVVYPHNPLGAGNFTMLVSVAGVPAQTGKFPTLLSVNGGSGINETQIYTVNGGNTANGKEQTSNVSRFDTTIPVSIVSGTGKVAMTLNGTAARGASNGGNVTALGTWTPTSAFTQMQIGTDNGGTNNPLNGYINRIAIFQTGMNDAQMQVLTT